MDKSEFRIKITNFRIDQVSHDLLRELHLFSKFIKKMRTLFKNSYIVRIFNF